MNNEIDDLHVKHEKRKHKQSKQGLSYKDQNPSSVFDIYWIYAHCTDCSYPESTENSGKWLIFVPNEEIDEKWRIIKKATEEGLLGRSSKVSTMKKSPIAKNSKEKVICVYTYNWKDETDVIKVRNVLTKLGFDQILVYKTDEDTMKGKYSWKGDQIVKFRI